ncbi:hypothetical protein RSAG8_06373, partial [Rhizoctonia solani AG-8 WAC10335]
MMSGFLAISSTLLLPVPDAFICHRHRESSGNSFRITMPTPTVPSTCTMPPQDHFSSAWTLAPIRTSD